MLLETRFLRGQLLPPIHAGGKFLERRRRRSKSSAFTHLYTNKMLSVCTYIPEQRCSVTSGKQPKIVQMERDQVTENAEQLSAMQIVGIHLLPLALRAALQLNLLDTIANTSNGLQLSAEEVNARLPLLNRCVPSYLDRLLRMLASHSVLTLSLAFDSTTGKIIRKYGIGATGNYFVRNTERTSIASILLLQTHESLMESAMHLHEAIAEGRDAFSIAHGKNAFQYSAEDPILSKLILNSMADNVGSVIKDLLKVYEGFRNIETLVDVGGGSGDTLKMIISTYPHIKGINLDLPHIVELAPNHPGVQQVAGDMFDSVPCGDAILLKLVLHNWSDEKCVEILRNCNKALPGAGGKLIVVDFMIPDATERSAAAKFVLQMDLMMLLASPGGKERTMEELKELARVCGFRGMKVVCTVHAASVIEFTK